MKYGRRDSHEGNYKTVRSPCWSWLPTWQPHGLNNYKDTKANGRHLKILTCKWTLRVEFIRVYRLVILYIQSRWCFRPSFVNCCPPTFSLFPLSPLPSPLPWVMCCIHVYSVWGGGYGVLGLRQINTCRIIPLQVNFFRWRHIALSSLSLIFLRLALC